MLPLPSFGSDLTQQNGDGYAPSQLAPQHVHDAQASALGPEGAAHDHVLSVPDVGQAAVKDETAGRRLVIP